MVLPGLQISRSDACGNQHDEEQTTILVLVIIRLLLSAKPGG